MPKFNVWCTETYRGVVEADSREEAERLLGQWQYKNDDVVESHMGVGDMIDETPPTFLATQFVRYEVLVFADTLEAAKIEAGRINWTEQDIVDTEVLVTERGEE